MTGYIENKRKRNIIFINIIISCIASSMLATAMTTILPPITVDLGISISMGQWMTSGYTLVMAIMMPLTAFLINRFPTKKLYCTALTMFLIGLLISAISNSFPVMMIGRLIQASANGIITSIAQVITLTIFPPDKRGTAMGLYGLSVSAAPVIAPTIAGILVDTAGWRVIFLSAFAIILISLIFALLLMGNILENHSTKFDISSFLLSAFAFGGITLGIGNTGSSSFLSPAVLVPLFVGLAGAIIFTRRQLKLRHPFLDLRILSHREFSYSVIGSILLYFVMMGSTILMPLYIQSALGRSATIAGLVSLPGSAVMAIISPFAGKIYDKIGIKPLFICGSVFLFISSMLMVTLTLESPLWQAALYNAMRCLSIGLLMMPLVTWGVKNIETCKTTHATALLTSLRTIGGAIGSALAVAVMTTISESVYDENAVNTMMPGIVAAYIMMTAFSLLLVLVAIIGTLKSDKVYDKLIKS